MFGNKELKGQLHELQNRVKKLEVELWKVHNPPKYKIGQKIKFKRLSKQHTGIIISLDCPIYVLRPRMWWYEIFVDSKWQTQVEEDSITIKVIKQK